MRQAVRLAALVVAVASATVVGLTVTPEARGFIRTEQPYISAAQAAELERWYQLRTAADQAAFPQQWARGDWMKVMRSARAVPALALIGRVNIYATGILLGWRIVRSSTDGSWDPFWALITGARLGTFNGNGPAGTEHWFKYFNSGSFGSPASNACCMVPAASWVAYTGTTANPKDAYCFPGDGTGCSQPSWISANLAAASGTQVQVNKQYCGIVSGTAKCYAKYHLGSQMEAILLAGLGEFSSTQPATALQLVTTNHVVPASGNSTDLAAARNTIGGIGWNLEDEINGQLAPGGWRKPQPSGTGGGPLIILPSPALYETYEDYVARLRSRGWLGAATVVELGIDEGDPAYGARGVPCTSVRVGVRTPPEADITFYVNPSIFMGGSSSADWDCSAPPPPPIVTPRCEYDDGVSEFSWKLAMEYWPGPHQQACADAWQQFLSLGGLSLLGHPESNTGNKIKNPAIIEAIEARYNTPISEWRKWEWGPFQINGLSFVVHAYKNIVTGDIATDYDLDYKIKFRTPVPH
jgi:hypothetical protein